RDITLYGQEKETTTANLARMNMILHNSPTAEIVADNTLTRPAYKEADGSLKRFDYVVANPPFSLKNWSNGVSTDNDVFNRFTLGVTPEKNGDYAFLLHIIASLKTTGKAAVVLPHGELLRRNAEGELRKNILKKGYIKGIIGLPANLFYGTGIPACIIVLDKEHAAHRKGIFMIDASKGFVKDGNKNRLREQDIRKMTDVFAAELEVPKYSRMVSMTEIADPKNDYNLNIPRHIDTQEAEDIQNIEAHLKGGIPSADIDALDNYWKVFPQVKKDLFTAVRDGFYELNVPTTELKTAIYSHAEFVAFNESVNQTFQSWLAVEMQKWQALGQGADTKTVISEASQSILQAFENNALLEAYDLYQHLMTYWNETMQDDVYSIRIDGWKAGNEFQRLVIKGKTDKEGTTKGDEEVAGLARIEGRMLSPALLVEVYFQDMQEAIRAEEAKVETAQARMSEIEDEQSSEDGLFADLEKVNATEVNKLLKQYDTSRTSVSAGSVAEALEAKNNKAILKDYIAQADSIKKANAEIKKLNAELEQSVLAKYPTLSEAEIKTLVLEH